jgi:ribokinase
MTGIRIKGEESARMAAEALNSKGVKNVIITMGKNGAYVMSKRFTGMVPGIKVKAVDSTGAGDVFNGALAVALAEGMEHKDAVHFANRAAAISVTRMGAQASAPFRNELE